MNGRALGQGYDVLARRARRFIPRAPSVSDSGVRAATSRSTVATTRHDDLVPLPYVCGGGPGQQIRARLSRVGGQSVFLNSRRLGVPAGLFLITPLVALLVIQLLTVEEAASPLAPL